MVNAFGIRLILIGQNVKDTRGRVANWFGQLLTDRNLLQYVGVIQLF